MKRSRMMITVEMVPKMRPKTSSRITGHERGSFQLRSDSLR